MEEIRQRQGWNVGSVEEKEDGGRDVSQSARRVSEANCAGSSLSRDVQDVARKIGRETKERVWRVDGDPAEREIKPVAEVKSQEYQGRRPVAESYVSKQECGRC